VRFTLRLRRLITPCPLGGFWLASRATPLRVAGCALALLRTQAKLRQWARDWRGDEGVEVAEEPKRTDDADEIGELSRLAALEANHCALGDTRLVRELFLREVPLEPEVGQAGAKFREDREIRCASFGRHKCQFWQLYRL
jgi:transposase-like protein